MEEYNNKSKVGRFFAEVWRVVCYFVLFVGLQAGLILALILVLSVVDAISGGNSVDNLNISWGLFLSAVLTFILMKRRLGQEWKEEGFWHYERSLFSIILLCSCIGLALNLFINGVLCSLVTLGSEGQTERVMLGGESGNLFLAFVTTNFAIPVMEEIVFRGTMLRRLRETKLNWILALIIQAVLFTSIHGMGIQGAYSFILGIAFGLVYLWAGTIWASIATHIAFNAISDLFIWIYNTRCEGVSAGMWFVLALAGIGITILLMSVLKRKCGFT